MIPQEQNLLDSNNGAFVSYTVVRLNHFSTNTLEALLTVTSSQLTPSGCDGAVEPFRDMNRPGPVPITARHTYCLRKMQNGYTPRT